jgi:hypothetical protein
MADDDGPNKNARNSDPWTSHETRAEEKRKDRATVWAAYKRAGRPMATYELEEMLGGPMDGKWRKRRSDLSNDGDLVAIGSTTNPHTNKPQLIWAIAPADTPPQPEPPKGQLGFDL